MSKDTIYRQDAIDAVAKLLAERCDGNTVWWKPVAEAVISALPSAQTEIIRCKDCKWYELPSHRITENCVKWWKNNGVLLPIKPTDFCSYWERREDD